MPIQRPRALAVFACAAGLVALAACGSDNSGPSYSSTADSATIAFLANTGSSLAGNTLDEAFGSQGTTLTDFLALSKGAQSASAMDRVNALVAHELKINSTLGSAGPQFAAPASLSAPFSQCIPTMTGVDADTIPIDTDADGIPDNWTVNFGSACVSEDSAGTTRSTYSGTLHFQDTNLGFFSYSLSFGNLTIKVENLTNGNFTLLKLNGSETAQFAAALANHATNFSVSETQKSGADTVAVELLNNETATFDPDGAGTLGLGDSLPAGNFDYHADFRVVGEDSGLLPGNFHIVLSTPTPLHYNPACGSEIDAGIFKGLLNGNANVGFTVTWASCGNSTSEVFGDTPATP